MVEIILTPIEREHLPLIQKWRNSNNVLPNCRQYRPLSMLDMENWHKKLHEDKDYNLSNDLFLIKNIDIPIGVGGLTRIDWRNRKGELSFYIAETHNCTKEIIKSSLDTIIRYGHATLGLRKICWPVYSYNQYLPIYKEIMPVEYIAKEEYFWGNKYYDRIILVSYAK